ncbi:MAG: YbaK/EbsC family protein [Rhodospirillales bacterium]|nr:YbaK/EbsC family protein [Rhodospirillales bacterium]
MSIEDSEPVKKMRKALKDAGLDDKVTVLDEPMESAATTAKVLDTEPGAIVQSLIFSIGKRMVQVLVAGDHGVIEANLPAAFFFEGDVRKPTAAEITGLTGFAADCVPPVGMAHPLPTLIDRSLKRFNHLYALAGDPQCVFRTTVTDLKRLTGGIVSYNIAEPLEGEVEIPRMSRTKTFTGERAVDGVEGVEGAKSAKSAE